MAGCESRQATSNAGGKKGSGADKMPEKPKVALVMKSLANEFSDKLRSSMK